MSGNVDMDSLDGDIDIKAVSGTITLNKLNGDVSIKLASGDIQAMDLNGDINIKASSGNIVLKNSKGTFKVKNASGDIKAFDMKITGDGYFKVASGNIAVSLADSLSSDLTLASASGDAVLDYQGNAVKGSFEFKALTDNGRIICPFKFDKEEVTEEKWGKKYSVKSFKKGGDKPFIHIKTATGKAVLKK